MQPGHEGNITFCPLRWRAGVLQQRCTIEDEPDIEDAMDREYRNYLRELELHHAFGDALPHIAGCIPRPPYAGPLVHGEEQTEEPWHEVFHFVTDALSAWRGALLECPRPWISVAWTELHLPGWGMPRVYEILRLYVDYGILELDARAGLWRFRPAPSRTPQGRDR